MREVVDSLPMPHYETLKFLMEFLVRMSKHGDVTKMTAENLARVFAPNVLYCRELTAQAFAETGETIRIVLSMIENFDALFNEHQTETDGDIEKAPGMVTDPIDASAPNTAASPTDAAAMISPLIATAAAAPLNEGEAVVRLQRIWRGFVCRCRLLASPVDMSNPLPGSASRIILKCRLAGRPVAIKHMKLEHLKAEKRSVRSELKAFDIVFANLHGREAEPSDLTVLTPLYLRYRALKLAITANEKKKNRGGTSQLGSTWDPLARVEEGKARPLGASELEAAKEERKRLEESLRVYQEEFIRKTGRPITYRNDRAPVEAMYARYRALSEMLRENRR